MSVYSGFATRLLESCYNRLLLTALSMMSSKLVELREYVVKDEEWVGRYAKVYKKMLKLEQVKYLEPKFTTGFVSIIDCLKPKLDLVMKLKPTEIAPSSCSNNTLKPIDTDDSASNNSQDKLTYNAKLMERISVDKKRNLSSIKLNPLETVSQKIMKKPIRGKRKLTPNRERKKLLYYLNTSMLHI